MRWVVCFSAAWLVLACVPEARLSESSETLEPAAEEEGPEAGLIPSHDAAIPRMPFPEMPIPVIGSGNGGQAGQTSDGNGGADTSTVGQSGAGNAGGSNAPGSNLPFSDDFEGVAAFGPPDPARWRRQLGFGGNDEASTIVVDDANAHGGSKSVRVIGTDSLREIVATVAAPRLFLRAWLRLSAVPTGGVPVLIGVGGDQNADIRLRLWNGAVAILHTPNGDGVAPSTAVSGDCPTCVTVPGDWFCVEMLVDDPARTATLWIDGVQAASVVDDVGWSVNSVWPTFPIPSSVRLGFWGLGGAAATLWIDDVAIAEERIGCD